jgi:thiol-disulfide isomerase/thioredoxin
MRQCESRIGKPGKELSREVQMPSLRALVTLVCATLILSAFPPIAAETTSTGLVTLSGKEIGAGEFEEGAIVAVFWASWSPRCRGIAERVSAIHRQWGDKARVVMVNFQEDAGTVESFLASKGTRVEILLDPDGTFSKRHSITSLPGLLVLQDGKTAFRGKLTRDPDAVLDQALD